MKEKWNKRYSARNIGQSKQKPSDWLVQHRPFLEKLPKGKALDIACGNGRNARFLASLGFEVDALDISDVVIDWLTQKVEEEQLAIHPKVVDLTQYQLPKEHYQVIINFNYLERTLFEGIQNALVPDGMLIFETFTTDHIYTLGRDISPAFVLKHNELLHAFSALRVLHYKEHIRGLEKSKAVASLVAQKM